MSIVWAPLQPVGKDDGIEFVRGSHRWNTMFVPVNFTTHEPKAEAKPPYEQMPEIRKHPEKYELLSFELKPGDVIIFDGLTVHGSTQSTMTGSLPGNEITRLTMRLVDNYARLLNRGPWTDRDYRYLLDAGLVNGGPLRSQLLPTLWRRSRIQPAA